MAIADALYHQAHPTQWVQQYLGFHPNDKQRQVLEAKTNRGILCCSRQWGKSTTTAAMAVHHAWLNPESLVLVASRTEDQSSELVRNVRRFLHRLGAKSRGDLTLPNGSRIVPLPGDDDNVRGYSATTLVLIDEECPRISPAFLARERRRMPRAAFDLGRHSSHAAVCVVENRTSLIIEANSLGPFIPFFSSQGTPANLIKVVTTASGIPRFSRGFHDDLVMATALAVWQANKNRKPP